LPIRLVDPRWTGGGFLLAADIIGHDNMKNPHADIPVEKRRLVWGHAGV
jgi:hypothetical protein